ncbi:nitrogen fixation protein FixH [Leptospira gomenensis]|uniref:Nitrogen fixation protein FixH n=1 Tax=Leptospira gomenensis TaxID=2484974 RepID=A0A5F1YFZ9_9LEPT|nr:FixH family protein [Leptospira gomenensis]TGK37427.1 nitrogen fixation protein FixH [Leptospira gomenensis]TGK40786.1 nitrogen fixation protein FixH [Leptospira gomenensis]TGK43012.1 nitrogen fixation protein FixH [Leptospira gomenensis]TGK54288.1 nitrogen fixation protein FixH [Leptospira gomenensis]
MALHKSMKVAFVWVGIAFVALISATAITIRYASEGYTGPIEKEYYEKGLNYEKAILEQKNMIAAGYSFDGDLFSKEPKLERGKNRTIIRFSKSGAAITGAKLEIQLERSATDLWNRTIQLKEDSKRPGEYSGILEFSETGRWILTVKGENSGKTLRRTFEVEIR